MGAVQDVLSVREYKGAEAPKYGITLDATPFDKLAEYTYYQNKDFWTRKNKQDDAAALEVAAMSALDINTTSKELYDKLDQDKKDIMNMLKSGKGLNYQDDPEAYRELHQKYGELSNNRVKATAFDVKRNSEITRIGTLDTQEERDAATETLDINTKLALAEGADKFFKFGVLPETGAKFTPDEFAVPKIKLNKFTTTVKGGDANDSYETQIVDAGGLWAESGAVSIGLKGDEFVPEPNPNNDPAINLKNEKAKIAAGRKNSKKSQYSPVVLAKTNEIIGLYLEQKKVYDALSPEEKNYKTPPPKPSIVTDTESINEQLQQAENLQNEQNKRAGLAPVSFHKINLNDEIDPQELVYLNSLSAGKLLEFNKKTDSTGLATSRANNRDSNSTSLKIARENNASRAATKPGTLPTADMMKNNVMYNVNTDFYDENTKQRLYIKNGVVYDSKGKQVDYKGELKIPIKDVAANTRTAYLNYYVSTGLTEEQASIPSTGGGIQYRFENGVAVGVLAKNGSYATEDDFQKVSDWNAQKSETKQNTETKVGVSPGAKINRDYE